jgi:prolyl-tRNA editing enzyme YbaK/EbsC (Cys-tRNA(Pro) deacylase)
MAAAKDLLKYLDNLKIKYETVDHKTVYTALDKASTLHHDPKAVAKTAVLKLDSKDYAIALVPANKLLDKNKIKVLINKFRKKSGDTAIKKVDFAKENWMKKNISGQVGATPPFGALWQMPTYVDNSLVKQAKIITNAGDYNVSLKLSKAAFLKAGKDMILGSFSQTPKKK